MIKYLVTGGCGFIGSNFINYLFNKDLNAFIVNLDALYYCASTENIDKHIRDSDRYVFVKGNLNSSDILNYIIDNYKIDIVVHFAAQSHVDGSFENSIQYTIDNVLGSHHLFEACRKYGKLKKFIHISTDEVYGESMFHENKKNETSILCPTNPYAATKAGAELIAQSYYHSFKIPLIITRGNNVYGPNQYPEKLIPKFVKLLENNEKVTIQGNGSNQRSFLHVSDVCNALDIIINKGQIGEIYNIGSDENSERSVLEIAKMLIKKIKNSEDHEKWIEYITDRPFNDKRYYISNQKLKDLGWEIKISFEDGINELLKL